MTRRRVFWSLLTAFVFLFLGWMAYVPYDPERIFESIPATATLVSVHRGLAAEWPALVRNPAITNLLGAAGVKPDDVAKLATDTETLSWIRKLAGRDTVFAYVPSLGYQDRPGWVFASWIGGRESLMLRLQLLFARTADFCPFRVEGGRTVYLTSAKFAQPGQRLSLALVDGLVVGCVSFYPLGARALLETGDRYPWKPSLKTSGQLAQARALLPATLPSHWGWSIMPGAAADDGAAADVLAYTLDLTSDHRLALHAAAAGTLPGSTGPLTAPRLAPVTRLLGDSPDLIAVLPLASVSSILNRPAAPLWMDPVRSLLAPAVAPTGALAVVALLNPAHSSRIRGPLGATLGALTKGLKVPTLVVGFQVASADDADSRLDTALNQFNARYGSSLARNPALGDDDAVTLIQEMKSGVYAQFEPDERIACTLSGGWLFICSNAAILKRRLAAIEPAAAPMSTIPAWIDATTRPSASGAAWLNLKAAGKSIRDAAAAATLLAIATEGQKTDQNGQSDWRSTLAVWRQAGEWLQTFDQGTVTAVTSNGITRIDMVLGSAR